MNQSTDQTKDNNHRRNVVNVYCERSSRNENSSTPVSMQQMITGQMTVVWLAQMMGRQQALTTKRV